MSENLSLLRNWRVWYRALRYRYGFSFVESVRYAVWLARG
jgi:hypothetical protein